MIIFRILLLLGAALFGLAAASVIPEFLQSLGSTAQFSGIRQRVLQNDLISFGTVSLICTVGFVCIQMLVTIREQLARIESAQARQAQVASVRSEPVEFKARPTSDWKGIPDPESTAMKSCAQCGKSTEAWRLNCPSCGADFSGLRAQKS